MTRRALAIVAEQERQRHERTDTVIESTQLRGIYESIAEDVNCFLSSSSLPPSSGCGVCCAHC